MRKIESYKAVVESNMEIIKRTLKDQKEEKLLKQLELSLGFYKNIFLPNYLYSMEEEHLFREELLEEGTFWYLNSKLHSMKERNIELEKQHTELLLHLEDICKEVIKVGGFVIL